MKTLINATAYVVLAGAILATCWAIRRVWRRSGHDFDAMLDVVKPCPDCAPGPHPPAACICVVFCGSANCTGDERKLFEAWEAEYDRHRAAQMRKTGGR